MNHNTKSSGSFRPRGRRSRRRPRPPAPVTEQRQAEVPAEQPPEAATGAEVQEQLTPVDESAAEEAAGSIATPPSERVPASETPPPAPDQSPDEPRRQWDERRQHFPKPPLPAPRQKPRSLQEATEQVLVIIEQLNDILSDVEEVSKLLDTVEVQQQSDEKEIESLRNALRQFQNPPHPRSPQQQRDPRDRHRGHGRGRPQAHERNREHRPPSAAEPAAAGAEAQSLTAPPETPQEPSESKPETDINQ